MAMTSAVFLSKTDSQSPDGNLFIEREEGGGRWLLASYKSNRSKLR
jgi:hypothetical protein